MQATGAASTIDYSAAPIVHSAALVPSVALSPRRRAPQSNTPVGGCVAFLQAVAAVALDRLAAVVDVRPALIAHSGAGVAVPV